MNAKRMLIGLGCFLGGILIAGIASWTFVGPLPAHPDVRAIFQTFSPAQKGVMVGCFVLSAYGLGMVLNEFFSMFRS